MRTPTLIATAALICLSIARVDTLQAQQSANERLSEEASKQSGIYESRGAAVPQGYVIDRSLLSYTFILPSEFNQSLADLRIGKLGHCAAGVANGKSCHFVVVSMAMLARHVGV